MTSKLPLQLYITAKDQGVGNALFGFLNAYEPNKTAFEKKRATQEKWAYEQMAWGCQALKVEQFGSDFFITGTKFDYYATGRYSQSPVQVQVREPIPPKLAPQIWNNTPLTGFTVMKSVSRWSTSNKFWRILDPRGIEFEISTGCMEEIIDTATILKGGLIDAKCAWKANKTLVVVP